MKGLVTQTIDWISHPYHGDETILEWTMFLALVLVVSFLWSTVLRQIE